MTDAADLKVLVVDDQNSMRGLAKQCLTRIGIKTVVAVGSGEEAMTELNNAPFDVIISDLNSGIDLLNTVRAHPVLKDIAFVLSTSECYKPAEGSVPDSKFVAKPFSVAAMRTVLEEQFGELE
jgi:two-component system, chemotaxis family, chemotaxis protein CheY